MSGALEAAGAERSTASTEPGLGSSGLGSYRRIAKIGAGGMAEVFLAMATRPGGFYKMVVLKVLREEYREETEFLRMFWEEAKLAALIEHPNVVRTYEVGFLKGEATIVMEYLEGVSFRALRRAVAARPPRDPATHIGMELRILTDGLRGLQYAHAFRDPTGKALGVVHRDFTPANLFVTGQGYAKVLDFGIAKSRNGTSRRAPARSRERPPTWRRRFSKVTPRARVPTSMPPACSSGRRWLERECGRPSCRR